MGPAAGIRLVLVYTIFLNVAGSTQIPVGNLSDARRAALNRTRGEIMQWAPLVDGAAAQPNCDTKATAHCHVRPLCVACTYGSIVLLALGA